MADVQPLEPDRLTWAVLLAKWTEFAGSAVALPRSGETGLIRQSVTDIIALQAVWFSLRQMDELSDAERALGIDRAGVLIGRHRAAIQARFAGKDLPEGLESLLQDVTSVYEEERRRA